MLTEPLPNDDNELFPLTMVTPPPVDRNEMPDVKEISDPVPLPLSPTFNAIEPAEPDAAFPVERLRDPVFPRDDNPELILRSPESTPPADTVEEEISTVPEEEDVPIPLVIEIEPPTALLPACKLMPPPVFEAEESPPTMEIPPPDPPFELWTSPP